MMRIAYVINSVEGGGAASPVPTITQVMRQYGAEVRVFALTRRDGRALAPMIAAGLDPLIREGGEQDHISALRWLASEIQRWGATHLWTSLSRATLFGLILGRWRGLPVVCWQHNAFLKPGNRRMLRALQSLAALWVADCDSVAALTSSRLGVGADRLVTWPIFAADATAPTAQAWEAGQPLCVGSLGRLHPAKGYDILMAALIRLQADGFRPPAPIHLTIAGEGAERARIESLARDVKIADVRLPGYAARPQEFLAAQHLYLQPSRAEGFCIAAHEAMSAGLPVLASVVGQLSHSIQDGITGYLVAPEDPDALTDRLHLLLSKPEQLHGMGLAGRTQVLQRFSHQRFTAIGMTILERLDQGVKPTAPP